MRDGKVLAAPGGEEVDRGLEAGGVGDADEGGEEARGGEGGPEGELGLSDEGGDASVRRVPVAETTLGPGEGVGGGGGERVGEVVLLFDEVFFELFVERLFCCCGVVRSFLEHCVGKV